ncbi:MAG: hypothetical protein ACRDZP_04945 [Acidimicrobiales bacterium]
MSLETGNPTRARRDCDLCQAAKITSWYHEDDRCWIADCEVCGVPMVVWKEHGTTPPEHDVAEMVRELERVAEQRFGEVPFKIDRVMRQVPDHFHAHARDDGWWWRRRGR